MVLLLKEGLVVPEQEWKPHYYYLVLVVVPLAIDRLPDLSFRHFVGVLPDMLARHRIPYPATTGVGIDTDQLDVVVVVVVD